MTTPNQPVPPEGYREPTEEELKRLPVGTLSREINVDLHWSRTLRVGKEAWLGWAYAVPVTGDKTPDAWQPIATAPRGGKSFLMCFPLQGNIQIVGWFNKVHDHFVTTGGKPCCQSGWVWQPLPAPPNEKGGEPCAESNQTSKEVNTPTSMLSASNARAEVPSLGDGQKLDFLETAISEQFDQAEHWHTHYKADPKGAECEAYWNGMSNAFQEALSLIQSIKETRK